MVNLLFWGDKIYRKVGEGTFGQVLECWDRETKEMVAIKVVRSIKKYREAAMMELDVLQLLGKYGRYGGHCVQLRNWFDYRNHICIVFEMLGPSLYDFLWKSNYRPFSVDLVQELGRQLLECVAFTHDLRLIHTDLKPENILFVSPAYAKIPDYKRELATRGCQNQVPSRLLIWIVLYMSIKMITPLSPQGTIEHLRIRMELPM
ncbi:serine/threonine-protein kinase AFC2-like isoform X2 [Herrania umbratica]|uniref:Serine/threonine-protein kinase AFC2-like isoform X2 n=1 Tax=Herrania umbratica TaxID=108875 RepID=A0A6J1B1K6_9ROSI|nr:serine/threonine-protein kinase AFC2-like isoform X2 [Herrania umbratica]